MHLTSDQYQTENATQKLLAENQSDHSKAKESASMNTEIEKNKTHQSLEAPTKIPKVQKENDSTFKRSNIALMNAQLIVARRRWMAAKNEAKNESKPFQVPPPTSFENVDPDMEIYDDELPTLCRGLKKLNKECVYVSKDCMRWCPKVAAGKRNVKLEKPASPKKTSQFNFQLAPHSVFSSSLTAFQP